MNNIRNFLEHDKRIQEKFMKESGVAAWHLSEEKQVKHIKEMVVQAVNLAEIVVSFDEDLRKRFIKKIDGIYENFLKDYDKLPREDGGHGPEHFSKPYIKYVTSMKEHFEKEVHREIFGGGVFDKRCIIRLLEHVHTYNELLHVMHAICIDLYKLEDEAMNEKIRILGERDSVIIAIEWAIENVTRIKSEMPNYINILSFHDKKIIQMRGYGHATVIEVHAGGTINDNTSISINYKIPKFKDPFFDALPGFEKKKYDTNSPTSFVVTGKLKTSGGRLAKDLANLIYHIPTDTDMERGHL